MKVEEMQRVLQHINRQTDEVGEKMWLDKTHLLSLSKLVPLEHVPKLQICHQVVKEHPYVIVGTRSATILVDNDNSEGEETNNDRSYAHTDLTTLKNPIRTNLRNEGTTETNTAQGLNSFMILPPSFLTEIKEEKKTSKR